MEFMCSLIIFLFLMSLLIVVLSKIKVYWQMQVNINHIPLRTGRASVKSEGVYFYSLICIIQKSN